MGAWNHQSFESQQRREKICPVCRKQADTRYFNESKKKYIYKHKRYGFARSFGETKRLAVNETIYHEADL